MTRSRTSSDRRGTAIGALAGALLAAHLSVLPGPAASQSTGALPQVQQGAPAGLTAAELQTLVAPIALFPDTLLIQILVAATVPLDVMKAERFLLDNAGREAGDLAPEIEAQGWDPSVTVLATAFPDVLGEMATHVDWTDTLGTAMLAQSEDVLAAVQVMREVAIDSGALVSGPEQTVERTETEIVIAPTNPEVVYVPQYEPAEVYRGPSAGDVLGTTLLTFGTVALIDEIFDDDDDWYGYWGCRNCGGWNGAPIVRSPDIDLDLDRRVNIGNRIDLGDREWKPDPGRAGTARDKIANRNGTQTLPGNLPLDRKPDRTNELRRQLSEKSGASDITRSTEALDRARDAAGGAGIGAAAGTALAGRTPGAGAPKAKARADAIQATHAKPKAAKPKVAAKPKAAKLPKPGQAAARPAQAGGGKALHKSSSGPKAARASQRGGKARGKAKRR